MKNLILPLVFLILVSCSASKQGPGSSSSPASAKGYGYSKEDPIKVGGVQSGPANERAYLDRLTGPNGERVTYARQGSCCPFKTPNGLFDNSGMLDIYEVRYKGLPKPVILYINMYDRDELKAPEGFILGI